MGFFVLTDRSHALRGNAARDAPRPKKRDAERHRRRYHAERGNDHSQRGSVLSFTAAPAG
jgi:hypothetical protein